MKMVEVGYSDSDSDEPKTVQFESSHKLVRKAHNRSFNPSESPRFGGSFGPYQDSITTQCSTPKNHPKHANCFNQNVNVKGGLSNRRASEPDLNNYVDPLDDLMSRVKHLEEMSNTPDVLYSNQKYNTTSPISSPFLSPMATNSHFFQPQYLNLNGQEQPFNVNSTNYPLFTSAINRDWDNIFNLSAPNLSSYYNNNTNLFKWWSDNPSAGPEQPGSRAEVAPEAPATVLRRNDVAVNTQLTSSIIDDYENRIKKLTELNEQHQERAKHVDSKNDHFDKITSSLTGEEKEFMVAVREHLIKVHEHMEVLMRDNSALQDKFLKSKSLTNSLYDAISQCKHRINDVVQENYTLTRELRSALQSKTHTMELCKSMSESLKKTNLEKEKILANFNNIANSKAVLENEFRETIRDMHNVKSKLIEWQSRVNVVSPNN